MRRQGRQRGGSRAPAAAAAALGCFALGGQAAQLSSSLSSVAINNVNLQGPPAMDPHPPQRLGLVLLVCGNWCGRPREARCPPLRLHCTPLRGESRYLGKGFKVTVKASGEPVVQDYV